MKNISGLAANGRRKTVFLPECMLMRFCGNSAQCLAIPAVQESLRKSPDFRKVFCQFGECETAKACEPERMPLLV